MHISFKSKDSKRLFFIGIKKDTTSKGTHEAAACDKSKNNQDSDNTEAVQSDGALTWKAKGGSRSSSKNPPSDSKGRDDRKDNMHCPAKRTQGR